MGTVKTQRVPAQPPGNGGKARISLVVDASLRKQVERAAKAEKRSLSAQCEVLVLRGLAAAKV